MRNEIRYKLLVPQGKFVETLGELTEEVSLEVVWFFKFQFMKRGLPFMGTVGKNSFDISRLDDIWAYPLRLKGKVDEESASVIVSIKPVKTAFLFLAFWVIALLAFSFLIFLQEQYAFFVVPILFISLPYLIISFTRKQLINHFEHIFRNQLAGSGAK